MAKGEKHIMKDMDLREKIIIIPIIIMIIWIGIYPKPFLSKMEPTVTALLERVEYIRTLK